MGIIPARTTEIDPGVVLVGDECVGIYRAGLHQMPFWKKIVVLKSVVNVRKRGRGHLDIHNQMGKIIITGFGTMDGVSHQTHVALFPYRASGSDGALMPSPAAGRSAYIICFTRKIRLYNKYREYIFSVFIFIISRSNEQST
jgi:hypothetical protein